MSSVNDIIDQINRLSGTKIPSSSVNITSGALSPAQYPTASLYIPATAPYGTIPTEGIRPGGVITSQQILRIINALNGVNVDTIIISGSFLTSGSNVLDGNLSLPFIQEGNLLFVTGGLVQGRTTITSASFAVSSSYAATSSLSLLNIITASAAASTITFTKGDQTTFDVVISQSGSVESASYATFALNAGTASTAISSSYALTASFALNVPTQSVSSSYALSSSLAQTASYVANAISSSFAISSSYALNADLLDGKNSTVFATTGSNTFIGDQNITGSIIPGGLNYELGSITNPWEHIYISTGSMYFIDNSTIVGTISGIDTGVFVSGTLSASFINAKSVTASLQGTASYAITASNALQAATASFATTASYALNIPTASVSSSYASTASYSNTSTSASFAITASYALNVPTSSISSSYALSASYALTASFALNVPTQSISSSYAASASVAISASYADTASVSNIQYVTNSGNLALGQIQVLDYSDSVATTYINGLLTFVFGTPAVPSALAASISGFDTNRFNQVTDNYTVNGSWNNGGYTLISASLYEGSTFLTGIVDSGTSLSYNTTTSGSHTYRLAYTASSPLDSSIYMTSTTTTGTVSKTNPSSPSISATPTIQLGAASSQFEQGATGSIAFTSASGAGNGWVIAYTTSSVASPYAIVGSLTGSTSVSIVATSFYSSSGVNGSDNSPALTTTTTATTTYSKIRSLRSGATLTASYTQTQLEDLASWDTTLGGTVGTIQKGTTTATGQSVTINWTGSLYQYIVYDSARPALTAINSSGFNVLSSFTLTTTGSYKVYRTTDVQAGYSGTSVTYTLI